jgi:hypothetical protein
MKIMKKSIETMEFMRTMIVIKTIANFTDNFLTIYWSYWISIALIVTVIEIIKPNFFDKNFVIALIIIECPLGSNCLCFNFIFVKLILMENEISLATIHYFDINFKIKMVTIVEIYSFKVIIWFVRAGLIIVDSIFYFIIFITILKLNVAIITKLAIIRFFKANCTIIKFITAGST